MATPHPSRLDILLTFLRLGCTSFGGPAAHLGYFRAEFVERRKWLTDAAYADLVALSQFLPGPASSQTGFGIGLMRGGLLGGLAAWVGFTLPSALLMIAFALGAGDILGTRAGTGLLHGLKLAAVAIVAQAVAGMARAFCPDRAHATIATIALAAMLLTPWPAMQIAVIAGGGLAGWALNGATPPTPRDDDPPPISRPLGLACLAGFALLLGLAFLPGPFALFAAFYRSGALVFGGGHVVLPLLHDAVVTPGWVADNTFLAGYGAAQALPGPLFTFATYLGTLIAGPTGALIALAGIFLPGLLLLLGTLPFWHSLRSKPQAQATLRGTNAAVVGLLGAALYQPIWTQTIRTPTDVTIATTALMLLTTWKSPPLLIVSLCALAGVAAG